MRAPGIGCPLGSVIVRFTATGFNTCSCSLLMVSITSVPVESFWVRQSWLSFAYVYWVKNKMEIAKIRNLPKCHDARMIFPPPEFKPAFISIACRPFATILIYVKLWICEWNINRNYIHIFSQKLELIDRGLAVNTSPFNGDGGVIMSGSKKYLEEVCPIFLAEVIDEIRAWIMSGTLFCYGRAQMENWI